MTDTNDVGAKVGIASTSQEYKILFTNSSTGADTVNNGKVDNIDYWIGSHYVRTLNGSAVYGVGIVDTGRVSVQPLFIADDSSPLKSYNGVRPVVSLDAKIRLQDSGTIKDGCKLYNIIIE